MSPLGFKARMGSPIRTWWKCTCYTFPEIHLWCDICWPLGGQHGSRAVSFTYLRAIGGTRSRELSCRRSQCEIRQTLYRLSYPGSARGKLIVLIVICHVVWTLEINSHGKAVAAIFLPQQMGCIGFNVGVHTAAAVATVPQVNEFGSHFVQLQQRHHEGSPDSGTLKSLNFSNFWTF